MVQTPNFEILTTDYFPEQLLITPEMVREMGLNEREYQQVLDTLGREPTVTELGMFSVMWSEHCGYKYSRPVLALFKNYKEAQEQGALENAGVIPLDDKLGICFKIESHNHPSAVEPFQGAAGRTALLFPACKKPVTLAYSQLSYICTRNTALYFRIPLKPRRLWTSRTPQPNG